MRNSFIVSLFITSVFLFSTAFAGEPAPLDKMPLLPGAVIELSAKGSVSIVAAAQEAIVVSATLQGGVEKSDLYRLQKTDLGAALKIFSDKRFPDGVKITIPEKATLHAMIGGGSIRIENMAGDLKAEQKAGTLSVVRPRGSVEIEIGNGALEIIEFSGPGKTLFVNGKKGSINLSYAGMEPGPGRVLLKEGNLRVSVDKKTKLSAVAAVLEKGVIDVNLPVSRPDPQNFHFSANEGKNLLDLQVKVGRIEIVLQDPK